MKSPIGNNERNFLLTSKINLISDNLFYLELKNKEARKLKDENHGLAAASVEHNSLSVGLFMNKFAKYSPALSSDKS